MRLKLHDDCGACYVCVSIPFSSGQRMRLCHASEEGTIIPGFNPLFIGSKDATLPEELRATVKIVFQSPFHRVKGCDPSPCMQTAKRLPAVSIPFSSGQRMRLLYPPQAKDPSTSVSIPFSSGQRMRPLPPQYGGVFLPQFQSPFHRVKGCDLGTLAARWGVRMFQSPFHRVKGCDSCSRSR